jgi:hypothetical protein
VVVADLGRSATNFRSHNNINHSAIMKVFIKEFSVDMEVKSSGIEFEVRTPDNAQQLGDCYLTMSGLV